jgi:hypothetical protein
MVAISQATINFSHKSQLLSIISWKTFRDDKEFLETLEDYMFSKILEASEEKEYVLEDDIFNVLDKNIWK